jgi:hypothetical protein
MVGAGGGKSRRLSMRGSKSHVKRGRERVKKKKIEIRGGPFLFI